MRCSGHTGMTPQLIFTILFVICTPGPVYVGVILIRRSVRFQPFPYFTVAYASDPQETTGFFSRYVCTDEENAR